MDEETESLIQELVIMIQEARWEARALGELLIDRKIVSRTELDARVADAKFEDLRDLKTEAARRAIEKLLANRPKQ
jgi:hypothetical protein